MATKAEVFQFLLTQQRSATEALIGGKVYFYEVGGTTPKDVYSDRDKTEESNPITLDANGTYEVYGDGVYRVVVTDADGVEIQDYAYVNPGYISTEAQTDLDAAVATATADAEAAQEAAETAQEAAESAAGSVSPPFTFSCWVPAGSMTPTTTAGAELETEELATNDIMKKALKFNAATPEKAQFEIRMPKGWDETTAITYVPVWTHDTTTTNFGVEWGLKAGALANDDAMDTALGTGVTVVDTGGTTNDVYIAPESGDVTIAGSPAAEELVVFEIYRDATTTSDTMAVDAELLGVTIYYTVEDIDDA